MREESKKEILTKEIIQRELKTMYLINRKWDIVLCAILGVATVFFFSVFMPFNGSQDMYAPLVFLGFFIVQSLYTFFKIKKTLFKIQNNGIQITEDTLLEREEKFSTSLPTQIPRSDFFSYFSFKSSYNLRFQCFGTYTIPAGKNYKYCKMYDMEPKGVYNYSNVGDDFYIVTIDGFTIYDKKEILLAYNKKLFELQ